jgi:hypothetical protein
VSFGQVLVGRDAPELTFMVCGEDLEAHQRCRAALAVRPVWLKLKRDPQYAGHGLAYHEPVPYARGVLADLSLRNLAILRWGNTPWLPAACPRIIIV